MAALAYALFFHAWDALNVAGNVAKAWDALNVAGNVAK